MTCIRWRKTNKGPIILKKKKEIKRHKTHVLPLKPPPYWISTKDQCLSPGFLQQQEKVIAYFAKNHNQFIAKKFLCSYVAWYKIQYKKAWGKWLAWKPTSWHWKRESKSFGSCHVTLAVCGKRGKILRIFELWNLISYVWTLSFWQNFVVQPCKAAEEKRLQAYLQGIVRKPHGIERTEIFLSKDETGADTHRINPWPRTL